ncbi:MAG: hypothetical protein JW772_00090 [Candidatus Diapherotrites archaeon]|nr:hypothetical protein [Candidatus Diapherotrites archaeon]
MFREFWKELILAAVLTLVLFTAMDFLGELFVPANGEVTLSAGLMAFSFIALFLPAFIGCLPSGYLIAKKTNEVKEIIFVPAVGAAIGVLALMLLSAGSLLLLSDAAWQEQMNEVIAQGGDFFATLSLEEYKSIIIFSVGFGAFFLAVINFAIGLAGGFVGSKTVKRKTGQRKI